MYDFSGRKHLCWEYLHFLGRENLEMIALYIKLSDIFLPISSREDTIVTLVPQRRVMQLDGGYLSMCWRKTCEVWGVTARIEGCWEPVVFKRERKKRAAQRPACK